MMILGSSALLFIFMLYSLALAMTSIHDSNHSERKLHIVYMGGLPKTPASMMDSHQDLLYTVIGDEETARNSLVHSYSKSFNAFAAKLLPEEAKKLVGMEGVVSVFPNTYRKLHTTRSWDFIGFPRTVKRNLRVESNMIIGLLDTGIWAESPSFQEKGIDPPPSTWKGNCMKGDNFTGCNNKVIGAKLFRLERQEPYNGFVSPADTEGHGTHTSSTAAGFIVPGANMYGLANGTARGAVPAARIAMYKVCWPEEGCSDADILAGFDDAISDGVDVISCSLGGNSQTYFDDPIAIGAFHAMRKGIITSTSAGNDGPSPGTVSNTAPWLLTVGATSMDRQFRTTFRLGNGRKLTGISINTFSPEKMIYPLISGANAGNGSPLFGESRSCDSETLDKRKVRGKIVYCVEGMGGQDGSVKDSGGAGALIENNAMNDTAFSTVLPSAYVVTPVSKIIGHYINTTRNPQAVIYKSAAIKSRTLPFVASFSSRGPNVVNPLVLKPDIVAPGLDILAAFTKLASVTGENSDNRMVNYNILSGTSMSCPHVSGAAAYVKSFHPDWSPAEIKSALITTAKPVKDDIKTDGEFGYGSGQLNPTQALAPGLVYDMNEAAYISHLCSQGINGSLLGMILGYQINCSKLHPPPSIDGLNYPTIQFQVPSSKHRVFAVFYRTVTNVGKASSVYNATVRSPKGLAVRVDPESLVFNKLRQRRSFKVVIKGAPLGNRSRLSASLRWTDSFHTVRSPIVVYQPYF